MALYLIVVFRLDFGLPQDAEGDRGIKDYYVQESGRNRHRISVGRSTHERVGPPDSHTESHGLPDQYSGPRAQ